MSLVLIINNGLLSYLKKQLSFNILKQVVESTAKTTSMVFVILVGAALFSLVFRGFGGDEIVAHFLTNITGGVVVSIIITMLAIFMTDHNLMCGFYSKIKQAPRGVNRTINSFPRR